MEHLITNLAFLFRENALLAYVIIYGGTIILGNIMSFTVLWIAFHGAFGAWGVPDMMLLTFLADSSGDLAWYGMGRSLSGTRFGEWMENHLPKHEVVVRYAERNAAKLVFLSKFIYSSSFVIIFTVGWARMEFGKFFKSSLATIALWVPLLTLLVFGLISGFNALQAASLFRHLEVLFGLGLVVFLALNYLISKIAKRYLGENSF